MSGADRLERLADLVVRVGANVQPGQDVEIRGLVEHAPIARVVAERAYAAGARRVVVRYADNVVQRSALVHAPMEALSSHYDYEALRIAELRRRHAAIIFLSGDADAHLFDGLDPERLAARSQTLSRTALEAVDSGDIHWTVVPAPNEGWARQIFGEPDLERLWAAMAIALRLDEPDPVAAWKEHLARVTARRDALQALDLDAVHFRGPGTDLRIGLIPGSVWVGGGSDSTQGVRFVPNLPTEEVFNSPDLRRVDGTLQVTKPLAMPRGLVTGLRLRLEAGRIVEVAADQGREMVEAELRSDPQAPYLGEIALVDVDSAVARAGVVFHNTVFDENAGSHVAWGRAYPETLPGSEALDTAARLARGLNDSTVHTDVVIGSPELDADGLRRDGSPVPLLRAGRWVLDAHGASPGGAD